MKPLPSRPCQPRRRLGAFGGGVRLLWLALALCVAAAGCDNRQVGVPTLPLPPPDITVQNEQYLLMGTVPARTADVFARNESTQLIFGQRTTDHTYSFFVDAEPGDFFTMWYTVGFAQSGPTVLEIPELTGAGVGETPTAADADAGQ